MQIADDIKCRFRYIPVQPVKAGLSLNDIVETPEKELNQIVGLKRVSYLPFFSFFSYIKLACNISSSELFRISPLEKKNKEMEKRKNFIKQTAKEINHFLRLLI